MTVITNTAMSPVGSICSHCLHREVVTAGIYNVNLGYDTPYGIINIYYSGEYTLFIFVMFGNPLCIGMWHYIDPSVQT